MPALAVPFCSVCISELKQPFLIQQLLYILTTEKDNYYYAILSIWLICNHHYSHFAHNAKMKTKHKLFCDNFSTSHW